MSGGAMNRMLFVDLGTGRIEERAPDPKDLELYLGGRGLGARLLYDLTPANLDPFDERMPLIFSAGPLTGTNAPQSNRFVVTTKSPLTGAIGDSHCGGNFATQLKRAGFDAVVIQGRSPRPVFLEITDEGCALRDAGHLWGQTTSEVQRALPAGFGMAVIGPAGENRVRYAAIVSQRRVAGRCGTGAVMGSKNLKAVIARGKKAIPVADPETFKRLQQDITQMLLSHPMTGSVLKELGTANLVMTTAGRNIIPTRNFRAGQDLNTPSLSGEKMRDELLLRADGCLACPIRCGRHLKYDGAEHKGPEFETIGLLGNNLGLFDLKVVSELGELCDDLGLDTISCGNTLGFAAELCEGGVLDWGLRFGDGAGFRAAIERTAGREGFGNELAEGTRRLSQKFGGGEYAIQVKGLELPAYDPRGCVGQGLEYATSNRGGCHIRGSTMYLEATGPVSIDPHSPRAKPPLVVLQQNTNAAVSSLCMCYFSAYAMIPPAIFRMDPNGLPYRALMGLLDRAGPVLKRVVTGGNPLQIVWFEKFLSAVTGKRFSMGDLNRVGERVFCLERLYNLREGLSGADDTLPSRLLHEPLSAGTGGVPLAPMLRQYYAIRGWDERGVPTEKTIRRLGIRT